MALQEVGADTRQIISDFTSDSKIGSSDIARRELAGSEAGIKFLNQGQGFEQNLGGDVSNPAFNEAINRRAFGQYSGEMQALKNKVNYQALNKKFNRLQEAANLVSEENAHNERVRQMRYEIAKQRKQARGAMLGQVLGIVGTVVGGIYGGPAGAAAGGKAGQALGQGIGG